MLRTIRNVTFVLLFTTVLLTSGGSVGGGTSAMASATEVDCDFSLIDTQYNECSTSWMYQGECEECGLDEYNNAIDFCLQTHNATMSEYFCIAEWPMYEFMCHDPTPCWD